MSTQIFINPAGCKVEYTKIAAHSFSFVPVPEAAGGLLYGAYNGVDADLNNAYATWSRDIFNYENSTLAPIVKYTDKSVGIPLPINLVADDVVTLSGTAFFNNADTYIQSGYSLSLVLGVYYFDCDDQSDFIKSFTFIPVESFPFVKGTVCFETSVTLNSNYDLHKTRFLVGFNIVAECTAEECPPFILPVPNLATLSYTFDIQRPCADVVTGGNFIIKNCCEPIITELVFSPGLVVGNFYSDDEGNCWEVIEESTDVTNFTRTFVNNYVSCQECIDNNPCPQNLVIVSCCVEGQEFVTGSLPGLNVGDTFVDNNGLCWNVFGETSGPISEESITVDTIILGDCDTCTTANPCPDIWYIESCCAEIREAISTTVALNVGDAFVDTNSICWSVIGPAQQLPTNYDITVDVVYSGGTDNCADCIAVYPCPTEYFLTIRSCCDPDRIEVTSVPAANMSFSEGTIFSDTYGTCWEVMSYSTGGVVTYPINFESQIGIFNSCKICRINTQICMILQVRDCNTGVIYSAYSSTNFTVGTYVSGNYISTEQQACFEILGYGYPTVDILDVYLNKFGVAFSTCPDCLLALEGTKVVELQPCCGGPNIIVDTIEPFTLGANNIYSLQLDFSTNGCYVLVGFSLGSPTATVNTIYGSYTGTDCTDCLLSYPCE
jgi:hypothetical protein